MIDLGVDFETYYDREYSLTKMTTAEYLLDSRFEIIGVGLVLQGSLPAWVSGDFHTIQGALARLPWDRIRVIAHNAIFDGAILEWKLGFRPAKYLCTMMGVRPYVTPYTGRSDLRSTLRHLGLGEKGTESQNHQGRHRADFSPDQLRAYAEYCKNDALGSCRIAEWLASKLPDDEADLVDLTIKKFTRPQLRIDAGTIETHLRRIAKEKAMLEVQLASQGIFPEQIRSRVQFAKLLEARGVVVPTKTSATTGQATYAFSKTDAAFLDLLDDERVSDLVRARLTIASNMEEARLLRLKSLAAASQGVLPAPLLYYGAHTGRFSGLDKINLQNLPRLRKLSDGTTDPSSGSLRRSLVAPPGYVVIAADLAAIEARITATLAGCRPLVAAFRLNKDVYSEFASGVYNKPVSKSDPTTTTERFVGKTCILGLGFGMGWEKFLKQMHQAGVQMTATFAKNVVYHYRRIYPEIPQMWERFQALMLASVDPKSLHIQGPLTFAHERILLPNGMPIIYPGLGFSPGGLHFSDVRYPGKPVSLWGGALTENVVQALARIILTRAELRLAQAGLRAALQVHDELVFVVPEKHVDAAEKAIRLAMTAPVDFLPDLAVAVEVNHGPSYGECK